MLAIEKTNNNLISNRNNRKIENKVLVKMKK